MLVRINEELRTENLTFCTTETPICVSINATNITEIVKILLFIIIYAFMTSNVGITCI